MRRFLGRPISRRLIAAVEAEVTRLYRRVGHPFVSVTTPEQEITGGVLCVRVVEFTTARLVVTGARPGRAEEVASTVRWRTGQPIAAKEVAQGLAWLNRAPFRTTTATFSPGDGFGRTDLALQVAQTQPWRVYGGYASSGTVAGGADRLFLGVQAAGPRWLPDAFAYYQFTTSPGSEGGGSSYASHAARLEVPIGERQALAISFDHVRIGQPVEAFTTRQSVDEGAIEYRAALPTSVLPANATGSLRLGVEANRVDGDVSFGAESVLRTRLDVAQGFAGVTGAIAGAHGDVDIDLTIHAGHRLASGALGAGPSGPLYAYVNVSGAGLWRLSSRLALSGQLSVQATTAPLPQTQQVAIGGPNLVRGYVLDDGAFDQAVTLRTSVSARGWRLPSPWPGAPSALTLSVFADAGLGAKIGGPTVSAASVGIGVAASFGRNIQVSAEPACALLDTIVTRAGTCRLTGRLTASY